MGVTKRTREMIEDVILDGFERIKGLIVSTALAGQRKEGSFLITDLFSLQYYCADLGIVNKEMDDLCEGFLKHHCEHGDKCPIEWGVKRWKFVNWAGPGPERDAKEFPLDKATKLPEEQVQKLADQILKDILTDVSSGKAPTAEELMAEIKQAKEQLKRPEERKRPRIDPSSN